MLMTFKVLGNKRHLPLSTTCELTDDGDLVVIGILCELSQQMAFGSNVAFIGQWQENLYEFDVICS